MSITYKDVEGIQGMRTACRLAAEVLDYLTPHIKPGITTKEIDRLAAEFMKKQGSVSATLGYQPPGYPPYPASLCTSVNNVVCHGIPGDKPRVRLGDIGWAIQKFAESNGFSVVREFCGHGIGRGFHEEPQVLHYGKP